VLRPATRHDVAPTIWACASREGVTRRLPVEFGGGEIGSALQGTASIPKDLEAGTWQLVAFVASEPTKAEGDAACAEQSSASVKIAQAPFVVR
jgi:hypothetical protein